MSALVFFLIGEVFSLTWSEREWLWMPIGYHGGGTIDNKIYIAGGGFIGAMAWDSYEYCFVYDPSRDWCGPMAARVPPTPRG